MSKNAVSTLSQQFRGVAGLPERKSDKPSDATADPQELELQTEPEGGYGGVSEEDYRPGLPEPVNEDGKTAAQVEKSRSKEAANNTTANNEDMASDAEGRNLTPVDKPAKKTAAKKTAAKKTAAKKTAAKKGGK